MAHILLVEPNTILAQIYLSALAQLGHSVRVATDAQAAIEAADEKMPDLVVLELQLVQHNGIEFLYEFRSYIEWQTVPVMVLTMIPMAELEGNVVLWHELMLSTYLYKTRTSLQQLLRTVEDLLHPHTTSEVSL